jgi:hypothetical protein
LHAAGKEIFYHANFTKHVLIGISCTVLGGELKGFYLADHGQFHLPVIASLKQEKVKYEYQRHEKQGVSQQFLVHIDR